MLRLAVVTPLDAAQTGVADYSRDLLPHLAEAAGQAITVFADQADRAATGPGWHAQPIRDLLSTAREFDLIIYQMGNSPAHDFMAKAVWQYPGLLVLHDISLNYFFARQSRSLYLRAMGYGYGRAGLHLGWRFLRGLASVDYPAYLVSEALVDRSPGVIVHSRHALELLQSRCPAARLNYVPMPIPLLPERSLAAARTQLKLSTDDFLIGMFGVLNTSKCPQAILTAMRQLRDEGVPIKAVFIGLENGTFHLADEALRLGLSEHVTSLGFVNELAVVNDWMAACDISINLRSPYWGETSASALRTLAASTPIIVNEVGSFAELPDTACIKLPPVEADLPQRIAAELRQLYIQPDRRVLMRKAARQFVAAEHDPRRVAARYIEVITSMLTATGFGRTADG